MPDLAIAALGLALTLNSGTLPPAPAPLPLQTGIEHLTPQLMIRWRPSDDASRPVPLAQTGSGSGQSSWIARHPVLSGALIGAGAGAVSAVAPGNELYCSRSDEDCLFWGKGGVLVGAGIGAGVGALVGWIVGRD